MNLTDHFLISMPDVTDPYFAKSLIYIAEHHERGALGLMVNRPLSLTFGAFLQKMDITLEKTEMSDLPVFLGGPVQPERGFVLHRPQGKWQSTLKISNDLGLTASRDILHALSEKGAPADFLVVIGYSGWNAGQLESEIKRNAWLTLPADHGLMFDLPPEKRLGQAMQNLGISEVHFSAQAGHA